MNPDYEKLFGEALARGPILDENTIFTRVNTRVDKEKFQELIKMFDEFAESPKRDTERKCLSNSNLCVDFVKNIYVDEDKKVVVTRFCDDTRSVVKCGENDEFDVTVGVALGICRRIFGNPSRFYKGVVGKKTIYQHKHEKKTEYDIYLDWCKKNHKRIASHETFRKNKNKYLAKMKGEK